MKVIENSKLGFKKIEADENKYITNYIESQPLEAFYATKIMYCPISLDISEYYEITEEQYQNYNLQQNEYFAEKEKINAL